MSVLRSRTTNLHLTHAGSEGERWSRDFVECDPFARSLILYSFGTRDCAGVGLRLTDDRGTVLETWVLGDPVNEVRAQHRESAQILAEICAREGVEHVYVSSLRGHSLEVFRLGLPCVWVHLDYFPFCPAGHLTREGVCARCDASALTACRSTPGGVRPTSSSRHYLELREALFETMEWAEVVHAAPSTLMMRHLGGLDSRLAALPLSVIEEGVRYEKRDCFGGAPLRRRLRVGLLGPLRWETGEELLRRHFASWRAVVDLYLLGAGDAGSAYAGRWGAHFFDHYGCGDLPALLEELELDLVLMLPTVPALSSRAVAEAHCLCLPVACRRLGAPAERVTEGVDGLLFGLEEGDVLDLLLRVDRERAALRRISARLREHSVRSVNDQVVDYYRLRSDLVSITERQLEQSSRRALAG